MVRKIIYFLRTSINPKNNENLKNIHYSQDFQLYFRKYENRKPKT